MSQPAPAPPFQPQPQADIRFEQAKQHFFDGLSAYQAGRFADAEQHYLASLDLLPGRASTLVNLAAVQLELDRPTDALATADRALAAEPGGADALFHRATALLALGRLAEAVQAFDQLLSVNDQLAEGWLRRAHALHRLGRPVEALASFQRLLVLDPDHAPAWTGSGSLLRELQRFDEAAHAFREALRLGADPELHAYYLASVSGQAAPPTAPEAYVQGLFDSYADEFDEHLVGRLGYQAHRQLVEGLVSIDGGPYRAAMDLGCGTGLCGPLVRPMTTQLAGIDLSAGMLERARGLDVYDRLMHGEVLQVLQHLQQAGERFDLVLAADVFIYIGDLDPVFAAVRSLMDRGVFCFSVESFSPRAEDMASGYHLLPSLRYAHTEAHLRQLAVWHDFEVLAFKPAAIRQDQRETVDGLFVYLRVAQRPSAVSRPGSTISIQ